MTSDVFNVTARQGGRTRELRSPVIIAFVLLVALIVVHIRFYQPVLHVDDWSQIVYRQTRGTLTWFNIENRRPLLYAPFLLMTQLFGENIHAFYFITTALTITAAVQFYMLTRRLFPGSAGVALLSAALFLIYPADYTRMYITMLGIRLAVCLTMLYAWLLLLYASSRHRYRLFLLTGALFCLLLSLGIYEAQLGIALCWALFLIVRYGENNWLRRATLATPLVAGLWFAWWRTEGISSFGISDRYLDNIQLAPGELLTRLVIGLRVLVIAWTEPISRILGTERQALPLLILYLAVPLWIFVAGRISRTIGSATDDNQKSEQTKETQRTLLALVSGLLFTIAGYVPIIVALVPTLNGRFSRVNLFAMFGAAIVLLSLLRLICLYLAPSRQKADFLLALSVIPFLALGLLTQAWVQYDANIAWQEQKQIWRELRRLASGLEPETAVYIYMPGFEERFSLADWRRAPLNTSWEVSAALRVLYQDESLYGDVILPDLPVPQATLTPEGTVNAYSGASKPYHQAVFVSFDSELGTLSLIEELTAAFDLAWDVDTYAPHQRLLNASPVTETPWQRLVYQP